MKRILLADDDGPLSRVFAERLKSLGTAVTVSHDAAHALFLMQHDPPDLAILDIRMPAGNGLAVCEMMRGHKRLSEVPVIIMSGVADRQVRLRAADLGARFVQKGDDLWERIRSLCAEILGVEAGASAAGRTA